MIKIFKMSQKINKFSCLICLVGGLFSLYLGDFLGKVFTASPMVNQCSSNIGFLQETHTFIATVLGDGVATVAYCQLVGVVNAVCLLIFVLSIVWIVVDRFQSHSIPQK